jgi:hypothetical protein
MTLTGESPFKKSGLCLGEMSFTPGIDIRTQLEESDSPDDCHAEKAREATA